MVKKLHHITNVCLVSFLMNVRLERRGVPWSLLVVSLATVRLTCGNRNSLWSWFYSHYLRILFLGNSVSVCLSAIPIALFANTSCHHKNDVSTVFPSKSVPKSS